jgi:TPR repeat protein
MNAILQSGYLALVILLALTIPTNAGPFEEGLAAAKRGDYVTALRFWRPLAEHGNATAQYNLGLIYENGRGVPQDPVNAVKWYRMAAEQGHANAQNNLGFMYANGQGVPQDYGEAIKWYRRAADQRLASAQYNLGLMQAYGEGVPHDTVSAHMWFNLAAAHGHENGQAIRVMVEELMSPDQIADAQRMAFEWMAKHQR